MRGKNTRSWRGAVLITNVDEVKCWTDGCDWALKQLRASGVFTQDDLNINLILENDPGIDMLRPYMIVGVRPEFDVHGGTQATYDLVNMDGLSDGDEE